MTCGRRDSICLRVTKRNYQGSAGIRVTTYGARLRPCVVGQFGLDRDGSERSARMTWQTGNLILLAGGHEMSAWAGDLPSTAKPWALLDAAPRSASPSMMTSLV